ncbi:DUF6077 domain-containing protein [Micromonospora rifamycinica]|uniref:Uncharacterized protein n=1 Tax=Micromonospora rifamycinica TaxID=291594 RepID=A0A125Q1Z1_9ACTN|nr:DUF6077 domain-containing protein [Micromonospora rifamycinica]KWV33665.1 hypothetical protein AWV63_05615 [Micromonospora rifamycinica]SCG50306.1 hypothetical protein GA0070623_1798 [Micromonospora rifamycinica]
MPNADPVAVAPPPPAPPSAAPAAGRPQPARRLRSTLAATPAVVTDAAVLGFALWTVLYHVSFLFDLRPSVTFLGWIVGCVLLAGLAGVRAVRRSRAATTTPGAPTASAGDTPPAGGTGQPRRWLLPVVAAGVVAAVTAGLAGTPAGDVLSWWIPAVAGAAAGVGVMLLTRRAWRADDAAPPGPPTPTALQSGYALLISVGVAISSLYLARNTPDDVYYVGKTVWVAERDLVPTNDFLFTENVAPAMGSLPPTPSIEVFDGALAHVLGIHGASATWYLALPVMAVLAVLALWRLTHRWAPRRPLLAFSVAVTYLYLVAGSDAALGTFHLPRLYEGKGMFVSAVIPLMWLYLTEWFDTRSRRSLLLVFALSVTAAGLTTTSAIILPMLVGAAGLAMLLVGRWKDAVVGGLAAVAYPVGAIVVSRLVLGGMDAAGADDAFFDAEYTYRRTLLVGIVGVISGLALWCGPLLARRRTPALLAAGAALVMSVLLVPGVLETLGALTGISVVLWRVPWLLALPTLIGLLCTVSVPSPSRLLRGAVGGLVAAAMVTSFAVWATPMWSPDSWVETHTRPTWKLPQQRQEIAFWIARQDRPDGLVLAPSTIMRTSLIVTSRVRVVLPRDFYLVEYDLNSDFAKDRLLLAHFADGREKPDREQVGGALERLGVGTICVYNGNRYARDMAVELGFEKLASRPGPGATTCYGRSG